MGRGSFLSLLPGFISALKVEYALETGVFELLGRLDAVVSHRACSYNIHGRPACGPDNLEVIIPMSVLERIRAELARLDAKSMRVTLDADFEPETGELVKVEHDKAYWHLLPEDFAALLVTLPDKSGTERVRAAMESDTIRTWHGPSPKDSRDEG